MDILAAIKREERKLEKQLGKLQHQLSGVRAAAKASGNSTSREITVVKKRVLSAAGRAAIVKAPKNSITVVQSPFATLSGLCIYKRDVLFARVIIHAYNDHVRLLFSRALVFDKPQSTRV